MGLMRLWIDSAKADMQAQIVVLEAQAVLYENEGRVFLKQLAIAQADGIRIAMEIMEKNAKTEVS